MQRVPLVPLRCITLLTDFGTRDGYVAAMRGVIHSIAPLALVDDASHDIDPGDVAAAAFTLARYARWYPSGSIHVVVVDPGVGTARRPLAALVDGYAYVAPDNGVLTRVLANAREAHIVEIVERVAPADNVSATFHGRDIFAPAAARLASGWTLDRLGPAVSDPVLLHIPEPVRDGNTVSGEVVYVDRFGNLITNVPHEWLAEDTHVRLEETAVGPLRRAYGDVAPDEAIALIGSDGMLEIAVRDGSAAGKLNARRGALVRAQNGAANT